jgi:hypothetical protein
VIGDWSQVCDKFDCCKLCVGKMSLLVYSKFNAVQNMIPTEQPSTVKQANLSLRFHHSSQELFKASCKVFNLFAI